MPDKPIFTITEIEKEAATIIYEAAGQDWDECNEAARRVVPFVIKKVTDEIIGEDFPEITLETGDEEFDTIQRHVNKAFNQFKAQQRQRRDAILEGLKEDKEQV